MGREINNPIMFDNAEEKAIKTSFENGIFNNDSVILSIAIRKC
jgi:hypothetical protein